MIYFKHITIYIVSILYIVVGYKHFVNTDFFTAIVPPFLIYKKEIVISSGVIEIILGLSLLFKKTRKIGSWGIILLLISVFPANIYLYISEIPREELNISKAQALIRIPFQIPLIILAYWHSQTSEKRTLSIICSILFVPTMIYFLTI